MLLPPYGVLVLWLAASGVWAQAVRRGDITRNPETGGLENVLIELDQALESSQCKNILASLKVCRYFIQTVICIVGLLVQQLFVEC
jgi:hypothetical protein